MLHKAHTLATDFKSSFLSCEKDQELILKKLFVENQPYSNLLKRLLIINTPHCLNDAEKGYEETVNEYNVSKLIENGYILRVPKIPTKEHDEVKSYILIEFSDIAPTNNPQYRDTILSFTIICNLDYWNLDDFKLRPYQIAGYIDGILNGAKLTGIGTVQFIGMTEVVLNEYYGGVVLNYITTHNLEEDKNENIPAGV